MIKRLKIPSFAKHGMVYAMGNAINSMLAFFLIPLYLRNLTVAEYGIYGLLLIITQIVSRFGNLGIDSSMLRSSYDYEGEENRGKVYFTSLVMMTAVLSVIVVLIVLIRRPLSGAILNDVGYANLVGYAVIIGALRAIRTLPQTILRIYKKSTLYITMEVVNFAVGLAILVYLIEYQGMGLYGLILGTFYSMVFNTILFAIVVLKYYRLGLIRLEISKQISFGLPLIPAAVSSLLFLASGRFLLEKFHTLEAVGIFTLAVQLAGMLETFFGKPLKLSWQPYYLENFRKENIRERFAKITSIVAAISLFIATAMAFFAEPIFTLFAKPSYMEATIYLPYLLALYAFWTLVPVYNGGVIATRKTSFIMKNFAMGAVISVLFGFALIPSLGIAGAILALALAYITMFVGIQWFNGKLGHNYINWKTHWILYAVGFAFILSAGFFYGNVSMWSILLRSLLLLSFGILLFFNKWIGLKGLLKATV